MARNDIKFNVRINIDGKDRIIAATTSSKELAKNLASIKQQANNLDKSFFSSAKNWANVSVLADNAANAFNSLASYTKTYTDAAQLQAEAETKIAAVMRERMMATEGDIQSIKDLASAQQELGIIGDEVTLMGAQQLATFVNHKSTLDALIPSMLDLTAQQKGFNASAQDAVSIANLFGKAMQGQTSALKRVGITFTEAQKKVMENGNESERAAMLAEIVTQNVGHMNAELRNTPQGHAKAIANDFGDLQEKVGQLIAPYEHIIQLSAQIGAGASGIISVGSAFAALGPKIQSIASAMWTFRGNMLHASRTLVNVRTWFTTLGMSANAATVGVKALTWALRGLEIASVLGAVFVALSWAVEAFGNSSEKAADEAKGLGDASDTLKQQMQQAKQTGEEWLVTAEANAKQLKKLMDAHADTAQMVKELNNQYSAIFGSYSTAAQWYDTLTQKSKIYAQQLIKEAEAKALAADLADKRTKLRQLERDYTEGIKSGKYLQGVAGTPAGMPMGTNEYNPYANTGVITTGGEHAGVPYASGVRLNAAGSLQKAAVDSARAEIKQSTAELESVVADAAKLAAQVKTPATPSTKPSGTGKGGSSKPITSAKDTSKNTSKDTRTEEQKLRDLLTAAEQKAADAAIVYRRAIDEAARITAEATEKQDAALADKAAAVLTDAQTAYNKKMAEAAAVTRNVTDRLRDVEEAKAQLSLPVEVSTFEDFDASIAHINTLLNRATADELPELYEQLRKLQEARDAMERQGQFDALPAISAGSSASDLDNAIRLYTEVMATQDIEAARRTMATIRGLQRQQSRREAAVAFGFDVPDAAGLPSILKGLTAEQSDTLIALYTEEQKTADISRALEFQRMIKTINKSRESYDIAMSLPDMEATLSELEGLTGQALQIKIEAIGIDTVKANIKSLKKLLSDVDNPLSDEQREWAQKMLGQWKGMETQITKTDKQKKKFEGIQSAASAIDSLSSSVARLDSENKALAASMTVISLAASLSQMVAQMVEKSKTSVTVWDWIAGIAAGTATIVTAASQLKGVGAFADGGVVSGPTLALVGEYAGATNNPEVIAPLSKLQSMIDTDGGGSSGTVHFEIEGRKLVGILRKEERAASRR